MAPRRETQDDIADSDAIERFVRMHSHVLNLAKTYSKLVIAGCTFFDTFSVQIHTTNPEDKLICHRSILGRPEKCYLLHSAKNVFDAVSCFEEFLVKAHSDWTSFISRLREHFPSLNYFDLKQIKYLIATLTK